jgi:hypothetical protein
MSGHRKALGLVGILGFAIPAAGSVLLAPTWQFPATGASGAEVLDYVRAHQTALQVGALLDAVGVTLWGVFGMGVWSELRERQRPLADCMLAGFAWLVPLLLAGFTVFLVLTYRAAETPPRDARMLYDLTFALLAMSGLPTALALGAFAAVVLRSGGLPTWTAALAIVAALGHVVLLASFVVSRGVLSLQGQIISIAPAGLFFWVLGTGVAILLEHDRA